MRPAERDKLLLLLAITSGSADSWSFLGLGNAFVANMTGNTVLLGLGVTGQHDLIHPLIALGAYVVGVTIGTILTRRVTADSLWHRAVSRVLLIETLLLVIATAGWIATGDAPHSLDKGRLLACLGIAIGLQSGAMLALKLPGIVTTYVTGTWTMLISGLTLLGRPSSQRTPPDKTAFEERLVLQVVFLVCYFLAAVVAGFTLRNAPQLIGALCLLPTLTVAIYSLWIDIEAKTKRAT